MEICERLDFVRETSQFVKYVINGEFRLLVRTFFQNSKLDQGLNMEDLSIIYLWMCCVLYLNGVLADDLPYQEFEDLTKVDNAKLEHDSNIMMGKLDDVLAGLNKREQETRRLVEEFAQKVSLHQTHQKEESSEVTEKLAEHMMKSETTLGQKVSDRKKRSRGDLGVPDTVAPSLEMNGTCYVEACPQRPFLLVPGRDGQPGARDKGGPLVTEDQKGIAVPQVFLEQLVPMGTLDLKVSKEQKEILAREEVKAPRGCKEELVSKVRRVTQA
ncbi:uncharacterized protein [Apostichopus japonicus]|uniref:uncharacterized protein n=1 Tax=Stichopus japonicus TaxID=307972 RepID=UPI003AB71D6E